MNTLLTVALIVTPIVVAAAVVCVAYDHHRTTAIIRKHYTEATNVLIEQSLARRIDDV